MMETSRTGPFEISVVPALTDNYIWTLREAGTSEVAIIDPSVDAPVLRACEDAGWTIGQILNTHWHPDHVGGNAGIKAATGCTITGPAAEADRVPGIDRGVREGDRVAVGSLEAEVWEMPAHTAGHIAYYFERSGIIFVGDILFAMGCGRLFEGSAEQMYANMQRLATLPDDVLVYPAHEYTLSNARFAAHADPRNQAVTDRLAEVEQKRGRSEITLPTTIALERATNPFMRASNLEEFARLRKAKDSFGS